MNNFVETIVNIIAWIVGACLILVTIGYSSVFEFPSVSELKLRENKSQVFISGDGIQFYCSPTEAGLKVALDFMLAHQGPDFLSLTR